MPREENITRAWQILGEQVKQVEYLIGYEGNAFVSTGDIRTDLLSITSVHPMREDAVQALLTKVGADWTVVDTLIKDGCLIRTDYKGDRFYMRLLERTPSQQKNAS